MGSMRTSAAAGRAARLRNVLLGLLGIVLAGLFALYIAGRQGAPGTVVGEAPRAPDQSLQSEPSDTVASSDAFDFTQTSEGRPVFSLHGDRFQASREGVIALQGVRLRLYREAAEYAVAAASARYDSNSQEASLTGDVSLQGTDRFALAAPQLMLLKGGKAVRAEGAVTFRFADRWRGSAQQLAMDLASDLFELGGDVQVSGTSEATGEEVRLQAPELLFDRAGGVLRAPRGAHVARGTSWIESSSWELYLQGDGKRPQLLVLGQGVGGSLGAGDVGAVGRSELRATEARLEFEPGSDLPARLSLTGGARSPAALDTEIGDGVIQGVASETLEIRFAGGKPSAAASARTTYFAEYRSGLADPIRSGRADSFAAEFADSTLVRVALTGGVTLTDPAFRGWGDHALFDLESGRAELLGAPARVETERGGITAPHLAHDRRAGLLTAEDGVRAVLRGGAARSLSGLGWQSDRPIQVEAREAVLQEQPRGFVFRGEVRAWQEGNLLLSDQLRGLEEEHVLTASGDVRTRLVIAGKESSASAEPLEIQSSHLTYREEEERVVFGGGVITKQAGRSLACEELIADLTDQRRLHLLEGSGEVVLQETTTGRLARGERARYDLDAGTLELTGNPVTLRDPDGAEMKGRSLRYDLKTGTAKMSGTAP